METRIFDKKNIIISKVNEDDLNSFLVDMDIGDDGQPYYPLMKIRKYLRQILSKNCVRPLVASIKLKSMILCVDGI